jgi:hypothetical protein
MKMRKIMIDAAQRRFTERRSGEGIFFTENYDKNTPLPQIRLQDCDNAVIKLEDQSVLIQSLRSLPNGRFTGVVRGFEPAFSEEFKGIKIGYEIIFDDEHVFSAGKSR